MKIEDVQFPATVLEASDTVIDGQPGDELRIEDASGAVIHVLEKRDRAQSTKAGDRLDGIRADAVLILISRPRKQ